jgi:hypothetical protein
MYWKRFLRLLSLALSICASQYHVSASASRRVETQEILRLSSPIAPAGWLSKNWMICRHQFEKITFLSVPENLGGGESSIIRRILASPPPASAWLISLSNSSAGFFAFLQLLAEFLAAHPENISLGRQNLEKVLNSPCRSNARGLPLGA